MVRRWWIPVISFYYSLQTSQNCIKARICVRRPPEELPFSFRERQTPGRSVGCFVTAGCFCNKVKPTRNNVLNKLRTGPTWKSFTYKGNMISVVLFATLGSLRIDDFFLDDDFRWRHRLCRRRLPLCAKFRLRVANAGRRDFPPNLSRRLTFFI